MQSISDGCFWARIIVISGVEAISMILELIPPLPTVSILNGTYVALVRPAGIPIRINTRAHSCCDSVEEWVRGLFRFFVA